MTNESNGVREKTSPGISPLQKKIPGSYNKDATVIKLPVKKEPVIPPKEFPVNKWIMPQEPQGYIKGNDNDCL
jgi:hypothetical protein